MAKTLSALRDEVTGVEYAETDHPGLSHPPSGVGQNHDEEKDVEATRDAAFTEALAARVVAQGLTVPAILLLESIKPLSRVASQLMVALHPLVSMLVHEADYTRLARLLEQPGYLETLLCAIEAGEATRGKTDTAQGLPHPPEGMFDTAEATPEIGQDKPHPARDTDPPGGKQP